MKIVGFVSVAALLALGACHIGNKEEARDAGPATDRNYTVGAFQKIEVSGPYEVTVTAGGAPGVKAHGGSAVLDETVVVVEDGVLKIKPKKKDGIHWNWGSSGDKVAVAVSGAAALQGVGIAGSGGMTIDQVVSPKFDGAVAGSGDLNIGKLEADAIELSIAGSGSLKAAGKAKKLETNIAGSGDVDLGGLEAVDAEVNIAGSGNIIARATGTANVSVMGSGDVDLSGGAKCTVSKAGSGNVNCH